jgi:hypothetical protein
VVYVQPGDIVVVGPPGSTAAPAEQRQVLRPEREGQTIRLAPATVSETDQAIRTLAYLPKGMLYAVFAPWPWLSDRPLDLLTVPEMTLWYVALIASLATLWTFRERWPLLLAGVLFVGGLLLIFALVEGNWGTLFRHRSMVIPFVLLMAAPQLRGWAASTVARVRAGSAVREAG